MANTEIIQMYDARARLFWYTSPWMGTSSVDFVSKSAVEVKL
jgi:hypothetical protein